MDKLKSLNITKANLSDQVYNGKDIIHMLAWRGDIDLINKLLLKFPEYNIYCQDCAGNTIFHILLYNAYCSTDLFDKYPESLYKINRIGYYVLHYMIDYPECFEKYLFKAIELYPTILTELQEPDIERSTILNKMCLYYNTPLIKKLVHIVLDKYIDMNEPLNRFIFYTAIKINSLELLKLLFSHVKDINLLFTDSNDLAYTMIKNNSVELLNELLTTFPNALINNIIYPDGTFNAVSVVFESFNKSIWKIIKKQKIDYTIRNKYYETLAHCVLFSFNKNKNKDTIKAIKYILDNSDLSQKDCEGNTPLDFIREYKLTEFNSYISTISDKSESDKSESDKLVLTNDYTDTSNIGIFNNDYLHYGIYEYILLSKYPSLTTLYQNDKDKSYLESIQNIYNLSISEPQKRLNSLISYATEITYYTLVGTIIWINKNYYFIHDRFDMCLINACSRLARFIYIKLSFRWNVGGHAGLLLYDKKLNKLIRFEPYGMNNIIFDNIDFDNLIKSRFENALKKPVIYLKPEDYMGNFKYQLISLENTQYNNIAYGDPHGYCMAWCLWWLNLKILNPDKDDIKLLHKLDNNITKYSPHVGNSYMIQIRSFAHKLTYYKNKFLGEIGINHLAYHYKEYGNYNYYKIIEELKKKFDKLIKL